MIGEIFNKKQLFEAELSFLQLIIKCNFFGTVQDIFFVFKRFWRIIQGPKDYINFTYVGYKLQSQKPVLMGAKTRRRNFPRWRRICFQMRDFGCRGIQRVKSLTTVKPHSK